MTIEIFRLHPIVRWGRFALAFVFCVWGLGGLFLFLTETSLMMHGTAGNGGAAAGALMATMAVLIPQSLIWIGGILFWGIAALLVAPAYRATKED